MASDIQKFFSNLLVILLSSFESCYWVPLSITKWIGFVAINLWVFSEYLIHAGFESFVGEVACKYFIPFCQVFIQSMDGFLSVQNTWVYYNHNCQVCLFACISNVFKHHGLHKCIDMFPWFFILFYNLRYNFIYWIQHLHILKYLLKILFSLQCT